MGSSLDLFALCLHEKFWTFKIFGMVQIFVDLIFDLQLVIENKFLSKITGYTVRSHEQFLILFFGNFVGRKLWRIVEHSPKSAFSIAVIRALDTKIKFAKMQNL